jgi:hypothetical protein
MYDGPKMLKPPLIATPGHANRPHEVAYDFFSRENAKDIGFHFIEQQEVQIQPPAGGAHTHTWPSSPKGEEVPNPTDQNENGRSRLVQPPTKNSEAARLKASRPRHSHCQAPPKKTTTPELLGPTYPPP